MLGSSIWRPISWVLSVLLPFFWALVPAADIILFALVPLPPMQKTESGRSGFRLLLGSGKFYVFILLMFCSGAGEMAISQWASLFAEKALGVSKVVGDLLGPCLFGVLMGLGRVLYGFCGKKIRILSALLFCSVLSMICYGMTVFCNAPILALIGCALCGFGVSLMWPGVLSLSAEKFSHAGTAMFAILALAGDFGCSCGPYIAGLVSDITAAGKIGVFPGIQGAAEQLALKNGMLAAMIFPLIMFIILLIMQLHRGKQK